MDGQISRQIDQFVDGCLMINPDLKLFWFDIPAKLTQVT